MFKNLSRGRPGHRFQDRYARRRDVPCGSLRKWATVIGGVVVVLIGIVLLPLPGPGMLVVFAGGALMADHSLFVARLLDRVELGLRKLLRPLEARWEAWRSSRKPRRPEASPPRDASTAPSHGVRSGTTSDRRTFRPQ